MSPAWRTQSNRDDQKLSLGSFLRPKSKEFVVCHDP